MPVAEPAVLSLTLPEATRDRLEAAASARGETVQEVVGTLVDRFLETGNVPPPSLASVVRVLREHRTLLAERDVAALWIFGSIVRGKAAPGSDIDLMAEFDPAARVSLVSIASLRANLSDLFGLTVDLVERSALRPAIRDVAEREAVRVL